MMKVGAEAALKPFSNLIEKLFGGPAEELGGMWQDAVKVRRFERQLKLFTKVQRLLDEAGIEPQRVSDKISIPLLNNASLEDDESLQDKWASLLANAATPDAVPPVSAMFPKVLGNLSAREAKVLDLYFDSVTQRLPNEVEPDDGILITLSETRIDMIAHIADRGDFRWLSDGESARTFRRLATEGLIEVGRTVDHVGASTLANKIAASSKIPIHLSTDFANLFEEFYRFTRFGIEFVRACRPPRKRL